MFNFDFLHWSSLIGTTLRALPFKSSVIITNYHACGHGVDENLLFSFDLDIHITWFQGHVKLWFTWSILIDRCQEKLWHFNELWCILQWPHDIHVHLFCFDLHEFNLFLLRSCAATCPTSNCGRGTSLLRQEPVLVYNSKSLVGLLSWLIVGKQDGPV